MAKEKKPTDAPDPAKPIKLHKEQYWQLSALVGRANLAVQQAQAAQQAHQQAAQAVVACMQTLGLDPAANYQMNDEALTIVKQ
ncbi:MAG: hypothetical protein NUW22_12560 [Acidobacteria bacterium]|nr:hypothetical protein [Acidobacteriota bacterium]